MAISKLVDAKVLSPYHGGRVREGRPKVGVIHSTETPTQNGRAWQSANYVRSIRLSANYFIDPGMIVAGLDETLIAWAAGTINPIANHFEFTGYAKYSRAHWLKGDTESGRDMIKRGSELILEWGDRNKVPMKFLSDKELYAAYYRNGPGGLTTHAQCSRVLGGTDHWDPGTGFPTDLLLTESDDMALTDDVIYRDRRAGGTSVKNREMKLAEWFKQASNDITAMLYRQTDTRSDVKKMLQAQLETNRLLKLILKELK